MDRIATHPIPAVVCQHVEEAVHLNGLRAVLVTAPHVGLFQLRRLDERLAAHLDGIAVAGAAGREQCVALLDAPSAGAVFVATLRAIEDGDGRLVQRLLAIAESKPETLSGLARALAWASAHDLRSMVRAMLSSANPLWRIVAVLACSAHMVDPGAALTSALAEEDSRLRALALRMAGECGRQELRDACLDATADIDRACALEAACSALLLGDRGTAVRVLQEFAADPGAQGRRARELLLKLLPPAQAVGALREVASEPERRRTLIQGLGQAGDPHFVPWLISLMDDPARARLAGEAFTAITGLDLAAAGFEQEKPDEALSGPTDEPQDEVVALDEDDGLPWPAPAKVQSWWAENMHRFVPGARYFMGAQPSRAACVQVLNSGTQRQRIMAAQHLCLMQPGGQLFPTDSPSWRQQRWLAAMGA